jgi:PAS domain S-box-containing protein
LLVAGAEALKLLFGASQPFVLLHAAVAGAALAGGFAPASTAILAGALTARLFSNAALPAALMFAVEALLIAGVVVYLRGRSNQLRGWLVEADREVRDLRAGVRQHRISNEAFDDLERASPRHVAIVLDANGLVSDWRSGAARLYLAAPPQAVGTSAAALFYPELEPDVFRRLLEQARSSGPAAWRGTHRRFDGTIFDAEVQLRCLVNAGGTAFSMVVHDLTDRQAAEAFARHAAERQDELREEVTLAQEQLASLETVTDPYLNAVPGKEAITVLLDRLRTAVNADGIAIVRPAACRPRLFWAADGLRPDSPIPELPSDEWDGRTLLIHNDEARVADMSFVRWPAGVRSMIAVPLLQNGRAHAAMEVVYQRGSRSTDWEIALIQVAAARAASLLPDESYAGTGAVA